MVLRLQRLTQRMPVLPKQPDETDCEPAGVWSSSPAWNSRHLDDGCQLPVDDMAYCCLPTGCPNYLDAICLSDLGDAVKVSAVHQNKMQLLESRPMLVECYLVCVEKDCGLKIGLR